MENIPEEVFEAVKELLPQIEEDLRKEIYDQLILEYQQKLDEELAKTKSEAQRDLESVFEEIQQQTFKTFQEKLETLEEREKSLEADKTEMEANIRKQVEEQLRKEYELEKAQLTSQVLEEFNTQMIGGEIEEKLKEKLKDEMECELRQELEKKEKAFKIQFKKKLEHERKLLQEGFETEWRQKIDNEKKLLEKEKSEIARLKSLQNLRLKKLEDDKKSFRVQMKEQENKYSEIVNSLQRQISDLETELSSKLTQKEEIQKSITIKSTANRNDTSMQQSKGSSVKKTLKDEKEIIISPVYQHKPLKEIETNYANSSAFGEKTNPLSPPQDTEILNINDILFKQPAQSSEIKPLVSYELNQEKDNMIIKKTIAQSFLSRYQEELDKLFVKPTEEKVQDKPENKENNTNRINEQQQILSENISARYLEVLKRPNRNNNINQNTSHPQEIVTLKKNKDMNIRISDQFQYQADNLQSSPSDFEHLFRLSDLDNDKTREMKKMRQGVIQKMSKDSQLITKYEAQKIYMLTEFVLISQKEELSQLLSQLFDLWEIFSIPYQDRLEQIRSFQLNLYNSLQYEFLVQPNSQNQFQSYKQRFFNSNKQFSNSRKMFLTY